MTIGELIAAPLRTGLSRAGFPKSTHRSLTLSSVRNGRLDLSDTKPIDLTPEETEKYQVRPGAFYVVRGNGRLGLVGRGALAPDTIEAQVAFPDLLIEVVPRQSLVDPEFLAAVWNEHSVRADIESRARTSSGIYKINLANLATVRVPLPSLDEQRRIAVELREQQASARGLQDAIVRVRHHVQDLGVAIRRNFFKDLSGSRATLDSLIREPGAITDGPFGSNLKSDHYKSSGVRVIRLGNIGLGTFIDVDRAYVTPAHAARLQRHRADVGDVVIAALGDGARPAGRACLVPSELQESIVKADCFRVRTAGSDLDGAFLMHVMNSPQTLEYIRTSTRGATRPRMNLRMLKELEIPIPSVDEQRRIVRELDARLASIDAMELAIRAEQEAIYALPAALLRRAFEDRAA